ncbi:hypothetical protein FAEPRAA2165_02352 [Faecalibacterium duncaniae]|uniref:Uncharacterized protein n=1 Tax=Faecalibacterium duncaniae (strain DSM 17677 / JCM 31915 / A2-165) TaxID=411483 RepID=C7H7R8_FAED2|nr:hypothetical protein FAEPRAA2165_02352 [Faecalibacterium duncaniae]
MRACSSSTFVYSPFPNTNTVIIPYFKSKIQPKVLPVTRE